MKKLLSLALVLAMVLTMSVTAFAAEIKQDTDNKTGSTDITYTVSESYIVTIPDSMSVGTDANVSVKDVVLASGKELTVSVSSTQYNEGWKLKNGNDTIGYTLKIDDTDVANNGTVLTVKSGETATKTLVTAVPENQKPKYSGSYTDTLTFSVSTALTSDVTTVSNVSDLQTALTSGGKYRLGQNVSLEGTCSIENSTSVILDLNGKTLTQCSSNSYFGIKVGSTLIICDNAGDGKVTFGTYYNVFGKGVTTYMQSSGTLIINGGVFQSDHEYSIAMGNTNAITTVNGGTIDSINVSGGKLTVTGGYIGTLTCGTEGTVEITGGTFGFDPTEYIDTSNYTVTNNGDGTWTVTAK